MANNSIFSGSSRYATDFGQLIDRAVRIASLPLEQVKSGQNRIKDQSTAMSALTIKMGSLRSAITSVNDARDALSVNVSNGMVASASAGEEALPGTYKLQVITTGSSSFSFSNEGLTKVTNPNTGNISSSESFTLTVGTSEFDLDLGDKSLSGLAAAINESDAPVEAVLVNVGTSADPDYRLSLKSTKLGPVAVQLNDGSDDLLASASVGTLATYRVNDLPAGSPISSDTAVGIEIAPGLKVDLLDAGTSAITVAKDSNSLTGALSSFARAYSEVVAEIDKHRGDSGGALTGQSILGEVSQSLRRLFNYSGSGSIEGAASLGLTFSEDGVLSFNQSTLASLDQNEIDSFLGAIDQDGFLEAADHILDSLDSIGSGLLPTASDGLIRQLTAGEETIRKQEDRIELLQDRLSAQMAAADALIASLEQQVNYINGLFESMAGSKK